LAFQRVRILLCQIGVDFFQAAFAVSHHRDAHRHVFADGGGVDVDVNDFGLGGKAIGLAGHPVIEPYADGDEQIAFGSAHVGPVGAMHADHSQPEGIGAGKAPSPMRDMVTGIRALAGQFGQRFGTFGQNHAAAGKITAAWRF
jgi:hypothetical protein